MRPGSAPILGQSWTPAQLPGLVLWLEGNIAASAGLVTGWTDRSALAHSLAQPTALQQPTDVPAGTAALGNKHLVRFVSASNTNLYGDTSNWINGSNMSIAAALTTSQGATAEAMVFGKEYNANAYALEVRSGKMCFYATTFAQKAQSNAVINDGVGRSFIGTYDGGATPSTKLYVGGVLQTTTGTTTGAIPQNALDANAAGAAVKSLHLVPLLGFDGDVVSIIVCNTTMSAADVSNLTAYYHTQFGV